MQGAKSPRGPKPSTPCARRGRGRLVLRPGTSNRSRIQPPGQTRPRGTDREQRGVRTSREPCEAAGTLCFGRGPERASLHSDRETCIHACSPLRFHSASLVFPSGQLPTAASGSRPSFAPAALTKSHLKRLPHRAAGPSAQRENRGHGQAACWGASVGRTGRTPRPGLPAKGMNGATVRRWGHQGTPVSWKQRRSMWQRVGGHHCPMTSEVKDTENWGQKASGPHRIPILFYILRSFGRTEGVT